MQSSSARNISHDYQLIASRALNTHVLGEHVAPHWGLGRLLRWVAPIPSSPLKKPEGIEKSKAMLRSVGLYKVQGDAVQAVMGGIFHQFVSLGSAWPVHLFDWLRFCRAAQSRIGCSIHACCQEFCYPDERMGSWMSSTKTLLLPVSVWVGRRERYTGQGHVHRWQRAGDTVTNGSLHMW